jgi:hypothetical protein
MIPWRTFFFWLLLSIAVSFLLMWFFRTPIVLAVLILPLGFLFSRTQKRDRNGKPPSDSAAPR